MALIEVKVTPQRGMGFDKIAERIYQYSEVEAVYLMSGAYDFTVFIEGRTMRQIAQFVSDKLDVYKRQDKILRLLSGRAPVRCGRNILKRPDEFG